MENRKRTKNSIFTESGRARNVRTSDIALLLSITSFTSNFQKRACGGENARTLSCHGFKHLAHSNVHFSLKSACPGGLHESISIRLHPAQTKDLDFQLCLVLYAYFQSSFTRASKNAPVEKYKKKKNS